jgi:ABC-2 type transport system permease protein
MPLTLYPDWFRLFCEATPFPAMVSTPLQVFLGQLHGADLLWALLNQTLWAIALLVLAHLVLQHGLRRLVIQGG